MQIIEEAPLARAADCVLSGCDIAILEQELFENGGRLNALAQVLIACKIQSYAYKMQYSQIGRFTNLILKQLEKPGAFHHALA